MGIIGKKYRMNYPQTPYWVSFYPARVCHYPISLRKRSENQFGRLVREQDLGEQFYGVLLLFTKMLNDLTPQINMLRD